MKNNVIKILACVLAAAAILAGSLLSTGAVEVENPTLCILDFERVSQ